MRFDDVAPILVPIIIFMIPIIAILTNHQRKMAELMHGRSAQMPMALQDPQLLGEIRALRQEVASLRDLVNANIVSADVATRLVPPQETIHG